MSRKRQLTSVYYLTSLHHQSGSDSPQSKPTRKTARKAESSPLAADDIRASWNVIKSTRKKHMNINNDDEVIDLTGVNGNNGDERDMATPKENDRAEVGQSASERVGEVPEQVTEPTIRNRRRRKRRKINDNLTFLNASPTNSHTGTSGEPLFAGSSMKTPSSDLLKCIHQFASHYYSERGQLLYAYKEHLRERQQRRLQKKKVTTRSNSNRPLQDEISIGGEDASGRNEECSTQIFSGNESVEQSESSMQRDMFMTLDGTALVAIGMLLQEYVVGVLSPTASDHETGMSLRRGSPLSGAKSPGPSM